MSYAWRGIIFLASDAYKRGHVPSGPACERHVIAAPRIRCLKSRHAPSSMACWMGTTARSSHMARLAQVHSSCGCQFCCSPAATHYEACQNHGSPATAALDIFQISVRLLTALCAGKTFTMEGSAGEQAAGVTPRAFSAIFDAIATTIDRQFLVRLSLLHPVRFGTHHVMKSEDEISAGDRCGHPFWSHVGTKHEQYINTHDETSEDS